MKALATILLISTIAYLAYGQASCSTAPTNCGLCASSTTGFSAAGVTCTQCSTGFMLTLPSTFCVVCTTTGCSACSNASTCTACMQGYAFWNTTGVCVALNTTTGCNAGTAASATTITCTGCNAGYVVLSGGCQSCSTTTATTPGTAAKSWMGVANCAVCTNSTSSYATASNTTTAVSQLYVTCTQCSATYGLVLGLAQATGKANGIYTPVCVPFTPINTTGFVDPQVGTDGNDGAGLLTLQQSATCTTTNAVPTISCIYAYTGCATYSVQFAAATGSAIFATPVTASACQWAAATYFCNVSTTPAIGACTTTAPSIAPAGCTAGIFGTSTWTSCSACNSSYTLISGVCVLNLAGCTTMLNSTNCWTWATGYAVLSNGTAFNASAGYVLANGAIVTGTSSLTGCLVYNSSSICVQCGPGFVSAVNLTCGACPAGCNVCLSSTVCANCASGYTLSTSNVCTKSGNCTNTTGTCYSNNMIATGLAFVSMIFYYIF